MSGLKTHLSPLFELQWTGQLSDYVTDLAWSNSDYLAASSGSGEVFLWNLKTEEPRLVLSPQETSIDCLEFSHDGQFLAAAGQEGKVKIWTIKPHIELINSWGKQGQWIDHLAWHPTKNQLAFSLGRYVQVVDVVAEEIIATLPFETSSVLGMSWHPSGENLAVAGNGGVKIWNANQWNDDPIVVEMAAACTAIAWSKDGDYLAASCLDNTVLVWRWQDEIPWRMTGFGGKIRHVTWSNIKSEIAPLLAVSCLEEIVVWKKEKNDEDGWLSWGLIGHEDMITDIGFQPNSLLLASVGENGELLLWQKAKQLGQRSQETLEEFSRLEWHPSGENLAIGGQKGGLFILKKSYRGRGFG
ncbi:WD40 repeat domain-containing protein [Crocosphaera chwakensis]|uniref:WD-40 repeat n=1 Tax=Crocosphaera chwakensis CCY0110 TaxID=391612 RepID=A3IH40_9CHRO|nr:WD40 repeat domain-containing protein [Crocosphaera chwakensis]EAZ94282.1 WD-40 repeat [Crocosphaera chwakensis CCY0110]